jgi:hypothetical protein
MAKVVITYTVDDENEIVQTYQDVTPPEVDDVSEGFIDIIGEQPTREERRS